MHPDQPSSRPILPLVLALFFLSGALALVYQVVWARMMTHIFGSTALAVGTVLAGFMAGLALGSWVAGRIADRLERGDGGGEAVVYLASGPYRYRDGQVIPFSQLPPPRATSSP